ENEGGDQPRYRQWQDDASENLPAAGAIDQRAFLELERDGLEIPHQQPGREWNEDCRIGQDQREWGIEQSVLEYDGRERDEQDRRGDQVGEKDGTAYPLRAAISQPHDGVGGKHAGDDGENGGRDCDQ